MSIQQASEELELEAERTFCGRKDEHHAHQLTGWLHYLDRLILEVQAEMPCYDAELSDNWRTMGDTADQHYTCANNWNDQAELLCPSCEARKELGR